MKPDALDGLVIFDRVATRRSFTAAAAELGITRSAASQAVRALEVRLGVALMSRTTRDVALNEAGAAFHAAVAPSLATIAAASEAARGAAGAPSGLLRLNVPRLAVEAVLAPRLPAFLAAHPGVSVEIFAEDGLANIVGSGFDAGIRLGELVEQDMVSVRLTPPDRLVVVGAPRYLARKGRPGRPGDLRDHDCINFRQSSRGGLYRWEFRVDGAEVEIAVQGRVIVNDSAAKVRAAVDGLGLAYELESVVAAEVAAGRLEVVLAEFAVTTPGFHLYFPSRAQVLPKLRAFIEAMRVPSD